MDVVVRDLTVRLGSGDTAVRPVHQLDLEVASGSMALLVGPSGCGKTTLLSVLAGLLTPESGTVSFGGRPLGRTGADLQAHRRSTVGVVFQMFNLVPSMTAVDNVAAPLLAAGVRRRSAVATARTLLDQVGLAERLDHRPAQLSGGQQQRVAIARSLAHDPPVILADEPTAHLDPAQVDGVLHLLRSLAADGRTVIVSTHDDRLRPLAEQTIDLGAAVVSEAPTLELERGDVLFEEGSRGHLIYVIDKGKLEVARAGADGREVLAVLGRGEHVGDMGALFQRPRSATVTATTKATVRAYSPVQFAALVGTDRLDALALRRPASRRKAAARRS